VKTALDGAVLSKYPAQALGHGSMEFSTPQEEVRRARRSGRVGPTTAICRRINVRSNERGSYRTIRRAKARNVHSLLRARLATRKCWQILNIQMPVFGY
jgi:hypothetical protein